VAKKADLTRALPVPLDVREYEDKHEFLRNYMNVICRSLRGRVEEQAGRMYCIVEAPYSKVVESVHPKAVVYALEFVNQLKKEDRPVNVDAVYDKENARYILSMYF